MQSCPASALSEVSFFFAIAKVCPLAASIRSNTPMQQTSNTTDTDLRLTELEIKAAYAEDLLEQLDQVIIRQQQQIDRLLQNVADLKLPAAESDSAVTRGPRDDLPPHF